MERDPRLPAFFWGDQNRIQQILLNLVNNAVKFSKDGQVSLSVRPVAQDKDFYKIEFSIKDTGIGMSSEQLEQVFTPFCQADSSISRRFGGTGLGLSIVKSLVELMGGSIAATSVIGGGSTFNVQLTLEADQNSECEKRKQSAMGYFRNIRVLVVEKSFFYANILSDYLISFGIPAEFAASELKALELLKASVSEGKPYNLLIIDHETLPDGGIKFRTQVKGVTGLEEAPQFIAMVPITKEEVLEKLEAAGMEFVITKPIMPSLLYNEIIEALKINVLEMHDQSFPANKEQAFKVDYPHQILIVEDNKTNQFIARSILTQVGFKVTLAQNGLEGYEAFRKNQNDFAVILMDLHMPVMNGYEATTLIRQIDADIPIIAMTADAIVGVEEKCRSIGITHYISKPFDPDKFIETVWLAVKAYKAGVPAEAATEAAKEDRPGNKSSVLDEEDGIKHMGGNVDLYCLVLKEYYEENQETAAILGKAIETQNYAEAEQILHKIKSSSGSIGAKELYETAVKFRRVINEKDDAAIFECYKEFADILKRLLAEIKQRISPD